ncbi:3-oxoacyl-[acyl-carrier protein] reductase [Salinihabitans flavidus]|uniref:3-oxoacyl-[acyl-carrier protein] reductase n=1 Tax=Salinihabitans flavidus TaxID=569882 RepID=A0A1H8UGK2_9RHOB|nr:SDR family oxidoreductase [Salinihabitans flavidus]SEP02311.1 3-oxoacyl-[acyl-carrier protein] reductase [Salinihabitans flavidus]
MSERVAIVTGAAGGMGQAIVEALLRNDLICYGIDIDTVALEGMAERLGDRFVGLPADLTDVDEITAAFETVRNAHGGLDVLVNNAGTCFMSEFPNIPDGEFERQMSLNFSSAFHCCQQAVKLMLPRDGVRKIVNISSNGAYNFDVFDPPHYRASKAALDNLTKDLARRYAQDRISVNSIAPAMTQTPLFNVLSDEVLKKAIAQMPHGRAMQPSEVAEWVSFLISPAGDISSGNVIILNQGRDVR